MKLGSALAALMLGTIVSAASLVSAQPASSASAAPAAAPSASSPVPRSTPESSCVERVPSGKARPRVVEEVPSRGQSGHALRVRLVVDHGKGETVLPGGFQAQADSPELRALETAGLFLPDPDGGAGPVLAQGRGRARDDDLRHFVRAAAEEARPLRRRGAAVSDQHRTCERRRDRALHAPSRGVDRGSNCERPESRAEAESSAAHAARRVDAAPERGDRRCDRARRGRARRRPRHALAPAPAPGTAAAPRATALEVAFEELYDLRHAGLVAEARFAEHFDRVSDIVRKYLGARFGFDGLESTTREVLSVLRRLTPPIESLDSVESFLRQADLVKFAKTVPSAEDCELALTRAERIISATLPEAKAPAGVAPRPAPEGAT